MSSPAEHRLSQTDFLARWMPSSTRAGVILNPCPDLSGSLQHISVGSVPLEPNDSFASDFAPLPTSADSSCVNVDRCSLVPGGEGPGAATPVNGPFAVSTRLSSGQVDSLYEMTGKTKDTPLMMKLEQLKKWQQHMQEQLKAHQLEELLRLQEEHQGLLGMMDASQHSTGEVSGAEWDEDSLHPQVNPTVNFPLVPQGSQCILEQERHLSAGQEQLQQYQDYKDLDDKIESVWRSRGDDEGQSVDTSFHSHTLKPSSTVAITKDSRKKEEDFSDRPIQPGIGGQKQTFEELLEEQLRLEEERLKSAQMQQCQDGVPAIPKRAFLKRGEGLSRFTNNRKATLPKPAGKKDLKSQPKAKVVTRSNSEPASIQRSGINSNQRFPVQRKTATLNKENQLRGSSSLPQDITVESKMVQAKVLGSHQRQNTAAPVPIQTDPEDKQTKQHELGQGKEANNIKTGPAARTAIKPKVHNMQPNPVTKQVGTLGEPENQRNSAQDKRWSRAESVERSRVPQDLYELSFQEKLHRWECNQQLESMELGEFELLEQAAEELSFSSNSSFVMKVLQMDRQHRLQAARGLHQRRLSSTPIKAPPREVLRRRSTDGWQSKSTSVKSEGFLVQKPEDTFKNNERMEVKEGVYGGKDECSDQGGAVSTVVFPGTLCFPEHSNPPYDKQSYQDEGSCRDVTQDDDDDDDDADADADDGGETDSVLSNADESTVVEDKGGQQVVFDDDDTWNDLEDTPVALDSDSSVGTSVSTATAGSISPQVRPLLRKVAGSKVVEMDRVTVSANPEPHPPPASQLMTRLFPSLKPRTQREPQFLPPAHPVAPEPKKTVEETGQQVHSTKLRERLAELEIEIERFKKANAALTKLQQENQEKQEELRKEHLEFEQMKLQEMAKFEEYKKEENRKLQKERKLFEKHASAARAIPDKKGREEIQALKQQVSSLQEELRNKESRWAATHSRQRQQISFFSQDNSSLREEIRTLEKLHISLKKNPVGAEKNMRDRPSLSSVTKAVKFASPLDSRGGGGSSSSSSPPLSSRDSQGGTGTVGMKSSLRRPSGSSTALPGRKTEEQPRPANESPEEPAKQDRSSSCSPERDLPTEPEPSEVCEEPESVQEVITHPDGKTEKVLVGGRRLIIFPNGTKKEVSADGLTVKVTFFNGDTKQISADQTVIYYYADARTTHITYSDGMEVLHFPNNQTEKHLPDGRKEITFPDQTVKNLFPDGREESVLTDGTVIQVNPDGTKEILFNTGQKEIHTAEYKRRQYPDGTTKTVYSDGRQETRYPNGRLRVKDKDGNVTSDSRA